MKKFISIFLSLLLIFTFSTQAFASVGDDGRSLRLMGGGRTGTGRADTDSGGDLYISKITFSIMRIFMK